MFRIGILGSDNSHAERFSEILNRPDHPSYQPDADARVVAIWGAEAERTQAVARAHHIEQIVAAPDAMKSAALRCAPCEVSATSSGTSTRSARSRYAEMLASLIGSSYQR